MAKMYSIYDRRTTDEIAERLIEDAIKKYIKDADKIALETYSEEDKMSLLSEAGFSIRGLPAIETLHYQSRIRGTTKFEDHIQLDFNFPEGYEVFDLHMEEHNRKKYLCIEFSDVSEGNRMERMFDAAGTEKCIEWCSTCEEEVVIDAVMYKDQMCPSCSEPIKACNLCDDNKDCLKCQQENK